LQSDERDHQGGVVIGSTFSPRRAWIVVCGLTAVAAVGCGSTSPSKSVSPTTSATGNTGSGNSTAGNTASAPGVTPTTITVGLVTSLTGAASAAFIGTDAGALARINEQNAEGGVDGRQIKLVVEDNQSSPQGEATAAESLVDQKHAFADISWDPLTFAAAKFYQQNGIPVVGDALDGTEWGIQPNTNMFSFIPTDPHYPATTETGTIFKQIGVSNAGVFCNVNPACIAGAKQSVASIKDAGITVGYQNFSLPFGAFDFTPDVLALKKLGINGVTLAAETDTDAALASAIRNEGITVHQLYATGYQASTLSTPTGAAAFDGAYFLSDWVPVESATPVANAWVAALKKYDPTYTGGAPSFGVAGGWIAADLFIKGLEVAGKNPTRASYISGLQGVDDYTAEGLLPTPRNFGLAYFGQLPAQNCEYYVQAKGTTFVPKGEVCGTVIPNSNQE
jgi:ABC-type branched-subunit amino acid transport system substrate-binding protein